MTTKALSGLFHHNSQRPSLVPTKSTKYQPPNGLTFGGRSSTAAFANAVATRDAVAAHRCCKALRRRRVTSAEGQKKPVRAALLPPAIEFPSMNLGYCCGGGSRLLPPSCGECREPHSLGFGYAFSLGLITDSSTGVVFCRSGEAFTSAPCGHQKISATFC